MKCFCKALKWSSSIISIIDAQFVEVLVKYLTVRAVRRVQKRVLDFVIIILELHPELFTVFRTSELFATVCDLLVSDVNKLSVSCLKFVRMWITFLDGNEVEAIIQDIFCEMGFCDRDFGAKVALIEFVDYLMREHRMSAEFICSLEDFQVTLVGIQEARANDEL
jgi:hypothetical protein